MPGPGYARPYKQYGSAENLPGYPYGLLGWQVGYSVMHAR